METSQRKIAVLGAGTMGSGIGLLFATKGFEVSLICTSEWDWKSDPIGRIQTQLNVLVKHGVLTEAGAKESLERIALTGSLEEGAARAEIVFESIIEDLAVKQDYFAQLDEICSPETILASNTSAISITEIAEKASGKHRIIGTHFWNPAFLIPLVEVVKTIYVSEQTVEKTMAILNSAGKKPVLVQKDVPGFLANRMQHALFREALHIIHQGIADAQAVEDSIRYGFGMRMGIAAPVTIMDMGGLDLTHSIHQYLFKDLNRDTEPSPLLKEHMEKGELGFKTGQGLLPWTEDEMNHVRENLTEKLIQVSRVLGLLDA